jgi:[acyl-carrier-protein] S-malonyltransferase
MWNSSMTVAFVFPGQGSQSVGMGKGLADAFAEARAVFAEVDDALSEKLSSTIWTGPAETLTLTENAQPALMAVSLAVVRVLQAKGVDLKTAVTCVAGHSLGEYSALAAAGAISLADTARLLRLRGKAMQAAVPVGQGAMAALLGIDAAGAEKAVKEAAQGDVCQVANDNDPGQIVISGSKAAVERAGEIAKKYGARRVMPLNVSAPFHCALMQPAAEAMRTALADVVVHKPVVPVIANVLAGPVSEPDEIRRRLVEQVTGTVRWRESVTYMASTGVTQLYEIGAGKVLCGLAKRIVATLEAKPVGVPDDIAIALAALT